MSWEFLPKQLEQSFDFDSGAFAFLNLQRLSICKRFQRFAGLREDLLLNFILNSTWKELHLHFHRLRAIHQAGDKNKKRFAAR